MFYAVKDALFGPWAWLLVLAVMISAISSTQTTILPTARGTLAMAVYKALPAAVRHCAPEVQDAELLHAASWASWRSSFYVGLTLVSENILADTILSLGLAIAFYYAHHRAARASGTSARSCSTRARNFVFRFLFPLLGALMLTGAFVYSAIDMLDPDYGYTVLLGVGGVFVVGVGSLLVGVVLMIVWSFFSASRPFFRKQSLNRDTEVLVPEEEVPAGRSIDGGLT